MTAAATLLGVLAGGLLTRRTQQRQWLRDAQSQACTAVAAAERLALTLVEMETVLHGGKRPEPAWRELQRRVVDEQMAFVNAARRSLNRSQSRLSVRVGGPPMPEP